MAYQHDLIIGIDPGTKGGIAWNFTGTRMPGMPNHFARKMSNMTLGEIASLLADLKSRAQDAICYIENPKGIPYVGNLPPDKALMILRQCAAAYGKLQRKVGHIEGVLAGLNIPHELVPPQKWMKKLDCLTGGDKKITREKAWRLYPNLKPTHDTADAILIMHYGKILSYAPSTTVRRKRA
jgi:hypothetical protein